MKKAIMIGDQSVELNSSAGWFYDYREQFGHDILPDLLPILDGLLGSLAELGGDVEELVLTEEVLTDEIVDKIIDALATAEVTTIFNITWAMAHNADDKIASPKEWVNSFDNFPVDEIVPQIIRMTLESSVSSKNVKSLLQKMDEIKEKMQ